MIRKLEIRFSSSGTIMHMHCTFCLATLTFITGCASTQHDGRLSAQITPGDPSAPSQVTPSECLAIARELSAHSWKPFANNILHGKDKKGVCVNTPDAGFEGERPGWWVPGEVNSGVPYKWGGFDDAASFDAAIANGAAGGDVSSPEKRRMDQAAVSADAAGLDCSGFVSRCLKLPTVQDTTQLPAICTPLVNASELRPGDILNVPHRHVILCAGWATPDHKWIYFYETGGAPHFWKPGLKQSPIESLLALGYQPMRYRGMATESRVDGKQVLTRAARSSADAVPQPSIGEP